MKNNQKLVVGVLVMALLVVSIGYAAITTVTLVVNGTAEATASASNFKVEFTGEPTVSDSSKVEATVNSVNKKNASITVSGLTAKDDYVTATYTVSNLSADLSASLAATVASNTNSEYFKVEPTLSAASIGAGNTATLTVKVTLLKTPVSADETSSITVNLAADPVQPSGN